MEWPSFFWFLEKEFVGSFPKPLGQSTILSNPAFEILHAQLGFHMQLCITCISRFGQFGEPMLFWGTVWGVA